MPIGHSSTRYLLIGHEDIKTTQIYLGSFDDPTKDAVMGDLL